jgi:thiamine-monophosphate kinase
VIVSVTALGSLPAGMPAVCRSGARPGDIVAVAGPLGHSAAGLALLAAGLADHPEAAEAHAELVAAHLRPAPPYDAGPEAARLGATAMIDTSDGLLADLGHVAEASGVAIDIATAALDLSEPLAGAAASLRAQPGSMAAGTVQADTVQADTVQADTVQADTVQAGPARATALAWALTGGEDHSLAATFPASRSLPSRWRVIGSVRAGNGVTVDGAPYSGPGGWEHFLSWGYKPTPAGAEDGGSRRAASASERSLERSGEPAGPRKRSVRGPARRSLMCGQQPGRVRGSGGLVFIPREN